MPEPTGAFCEAVVAAFERVARRTDSDRVAVQALWEDLERVGMADGSLARVLAWDRGRDAARTYLKTITTLLRQGRCPPLSLCVDAAGEPLAVLE